MFWGNLQLFALTGVATFLFVKFLQSRQAIAAARAYKLSTTNDVTTGNTPPNTLGGYQPFTGIPTAGAQRDLQRSESHYGANAGVAPARSATHSRCHNCKR